MNTIVAFFLSILLFILVFQFLSPLVINYKIRGRYVLVVVFGLIPIFYINLTNIKIVKKVSPWDGLLYFIPIRFNIRNKLWSETVILERKKGLIFKQWAITPSKINKFISEIQKIIQLL
jgi:hypothetical protein